MSCLGSNLGYETESTNNYKQQSESQSHLKPQVNQQVHCMRLSAWNHFKLTFYFLNIHYTSISHGTININTHIYTSIY